MLFEKGKVRKIGLSTVLVVTMGILMFIANLTVMIYQRRDSPNPNDTRASAAITKRTNYDRLFYASASFSRSQSRSMETTVQCIGPIYNQSCLYKNLYYFNGRFWALSLTKSQLSLPGVRLEALATTDFRPQHRVFDSYEDLHEFIHSKIDPAVLPGLTLHFNQRWHGNIGHALFDGLYPAYVALIRFAPEHRQPFRVFVGLDKQTCNSCFSEDVYSRFAGLGMIKSGVADLLVYDRWLVFEKLIMGSGMMCQRCIQSNYQLPGGVELDGSRLFRDRMYRQFNLVPPYVRSNHSAEKRNPARPLHAYIVHNKRFTTEEQAELREAMNEINTYMDTHINKSIEEIKKLPYPLVRVVYLDYRTVTPNNHMAARINSSRVKIESAAYELIESNFSAQLRLLRRMDIHITGPGTGQMYQTFLSDGSVNINLGGMNPYTKERTPIAYPSFLEQYVTGGTPYIKGLYYPINKRRDGIKRVEVLNLIRQAAKLIMDGFSIPVNPKENLAPDGQVFVDQCASDKDFCTLVTTRRSGYFWCNNMWTEDLVHERRQWAEGGFPIGGSNVTCSFNRTLLRSLREKYGIEYRPGRE